MQIVFTDGSKKDLDEMDNSSYLLFEQHIKKMMATPPRKHMQHGLPYFKEDVGGGRIVCQIDGNTIYIVRCFTTHREYEKWYSKL